MKKLFILLFTFCLCAVVYSQKIRYTAYDKTKREPKADSADIRIFSTPASISFKFKEIGLLTVDDRGWGKNENKLMESANKEVKKYGADGILLLDQDNKVDGYYYGMAFNRKILRMSVIVKEEE